MSSEKLPQNQPASETTPPVPPSLEVLEQHLRDKDSGNVASIDCAPFGADKATVTFRGVRYGEDLPFGYEDTGEAYVVPRSVAVELGLRAASNSYAMRDADNKSPDIHSARYNLVFTDQTLVNVHSMRAESPSSTHREDFDAWEAEFSNNNPEATSTNQE